MSSPLPAGMMRTARGVRISTRPANDRDGIVMTIFGIEVRMTGRESAELRGKLETAEQQSKAGDAFDEI